MNKRILSLFLASVIAAGTVAAVSAEDSSERAKGIVFTAESGYNANSYTGYVGGVEFGTTAGALLSALENKNGIEVIRDKTLGADDEIKHGDKLALVTEDGAVKTEYEIIFMGNADREGKLNLNDVSAMLKKIAKWDVDIDAVAADVDGNGNVNLSDVSAVLKKIAKWDVDFVKIPVLPGQGTATVNKVLQTFAGGERSNVNLRKGQDLAIKFSVAEGEYAKYVKAVYPSWGDNKGSLRLSLYKWDTDYETTVSAMPIVSEKYVDFADCSEIVFSFTDTAGKGVGEGEYLWRIHEGFDERINPDDNNEPVGVGMWTYACPAADSGITVFYKGAAMDPAAEDSFAPEAYIGIGK